MTAMRITRGPLRGVELETAVTGHPRIARLRLRLRAWKRRRPDRADDTREAAETAVVD